MNFCHFLVTLHGSLLLCRYWLDQCPDDVFWNQSDTGWAKAAWFVGPWIQGSCLFIHELPTFSPDLTLKVIHDDVIKWKHFPRYWSFVRGIHRSTVNSPRKGQWRGALMNFFDLRLNKRLSKQSWGWLFETPSRLLWRHCNFEITGYSPNVTWDAIDTSKSNAVICTNRGGPPHWARHSGGWWTGRANNVMELYRHRWVSAKKT